MWYVKCFCLMQPVYWTKQYIKTAVINLGLFRHQKCPSLYYLHSKKKLCEDQIKHDTYRLTFIKLTLMNTLRRPKSRPSSFFHAHCFQFLWSASAPFFPASPFWPRDPVEPIIPLSPFAPSRPSRPGKPLCPLKPGTSGSIGDPCRHVLVFCVI